MSFAFKSDYKPVTVSGSDFLYLEHAVCFFSLKTFEEAALGIGINFTKDARWVYSDTQGFEYDSVLILIMVLVWVYCYTCGFSMSLLLYIWFQYESILIHMVSMLIYSDTYGFSMRYTMY